MSENTSSEVEENKQLVQSQQALIEISHQGVFNQQLLTILTQMLEEMKKSNEIEQKRMEALEKLS